MTSCLLQYLVARHSRISWTRTYLQYSTLNESGPVEAPHSAWGGLAFCDRRQHGPWTSMYLCTRLGYVCPVSSRQVVRRTNSCSAASLQTQLQGVPCHPPRFGKRAETNPFQTMTAFDCEQHMSHVGWV